MVNKDLRSSSRKKGASPRKQWTARFPKDIEKTLLEMKSDLGFRQKSDVIKHIITIYLAEKRLLPRSPKEGI